MNECIFCKIIKGEIPSYTVYEDDIIKAFLDINPCTKGHLLIIPKKHYTNVFDVDQKVIDHSINAIKEKLYPLVKEKLNCDGLTISQNNDYGQEVKHYHIHMIPRYINDEDKHIYYKETLLPLDELYEILK